MKNGIYKVKPFEEIRHLKEPLWGWFMEFSCPNSRNIRIRDDKWNISGEEFQVCPEMFEDGPI